MATIIYPTPVFSPNTLARASEVTANFDAISDEVNGNLDTDNLADNAVTSTKIEDAAVTTAKIGTGAVTELKIGDAAVTAAKVASNAVTTAKIANEAVTNAKLADGISAEKISHPTGGIGTYALLQYSTVALPGDTYSSGLSYASASGVAYGPVSGTWRCMGAIPVGGGVTLFVRIS
jgi:hypothetical protein